MKGYLLIIKWPYRFFLKKENDKRYLRSSIPDPLPFPFFLLLSPLSPCLLIFLGMQALLESVADCLSTTLGQGKVTLPPSALQVTRLREGMEEPVTLLLQRYQDVLPVLPDPKGLERANSHCGPACHDDRTSPIWDWSIKGTALALEVSDRALVSQCLKTTLLRDQDGASQGWELALTSFPDARAYLYVKSLTASSPLRYQTGKVQHIGAFIADHDHHGFRPFQDPLLGSLMSPTDLADDFISVTTCNRSCNDLLSPLDVVTSSSQRIFLVDQSPEGNAWMRKWKALKKESNSSSYPLEEWVTLGPCPYSLKDLEGMAKRLADEEFPPSCSEWLDAEKVKEACRICAWTTLAFTFLSPRLTSPMKIDFATMARERPGVYVQYTHSRLSG